MALALGCLIAWLLGGIPFGLVLVRLLLGVDIRTIGSGNVGATNASRAFTGWRQPAVFLLIYGLDFGKGMAPVLLLPDWLGLEGAVAPCGIGASAIAGHCASPYLRLRGGKGVATTMGVVAGIEPWALLCALLAFVVVWRLSRQVFAGSLALGVMLPVAVVLREPATAFGQRLPVTLLCIALAGLLFVTHRSNLKKALARRRTPLGSSA
jgi:glycerol-3-phosphate acyltransferase PlsY